MSSAKGFTELANKLRNIGVQGEQMVKAEIEGATRDIEVKAKQKAPVDLGTLRRSIYSIVDNGGLRGEIGANAKYAAYQEFGTGGLVNVPEEMKDIAIQYKGSGKRQINMKPQPFLYPAFVEGRAKLIEQLKKGLVKLTK